MCLIPEMSLVGGSVAVRVIGQKDEYRITTTTTSFQQKGVFE
jgi:hypothetical protein